MSFDFVVRVWRRRKPPSRDAWRDGASGADADDPTSSSSCRCCVVEEEEEEEEEEGAAGAVCLAGCFLATRGERDLTAAGRSCFLVFGDAGNDMEVEVGGNTSGDAETVASLRWTFGLVALSFHR